MASSRKFQPAVVLLILLIVATGMAPAAVQARDCERDSEKFSGACMFSDNCSLVCKGEGFAEGRCSTFRRRCVCIKPC